MSHVGSRGAAAFQLALTHSNPVSTHWASAPFSSLTARPTWREYDSNIRERCSYTYPANQRTRDICGMRMVRSIPTRDLHVCYLACLLTMDWMVWIAGPNISPDVVIVRTKHRICGLLSGTLPLIPQQNVFLGLPLQLTPEEVTLLVQRG